MIKPESVEAIQMSTPEEVLDTRSPKEIEEELIRKHEESALKAASKISPADQASIFFQNFYPMFKSRLGFLSNKDARRVIDAIVQWPLEEENPKFNSDIAEEVFVLGTRLLDAKMIMRNTVELEQMQNVLDKKQETGDNPKTSEGVEITSEFIKENEQNDTN
jgi:hypothetical protein